MTPATRRSGAVLITVGDELLLGRTVDTNSAWLGHALADLGVRVVRSHTVSDDDQEIGAALQAASDAPLVILTGGLGPTHDDHTREAVAAATELSLEPRAEVLDHLKGYYVSRGRPFPDIARKVALVPEGAEIILNPVGTAPAILLRYREAHVLLLPGIPREMKALFALAAPVLAERLTDRLPRVAIRTWATSGIGESALAPLLEQALEDAGLAGAVDGQPWELAYLPSLRGVGLRATLGITNDASSVEVSGRGSVEVLDRIGEVIESVIAAWRIPEEASGEVVEAVAAHLLRGGETLATAESCTGGLIAKRATDQPGSSRWFLGGVVAYSNDAKMALLGVEETTLETMGAVSERVAEQMARGAMRTFGADSGIGVTGIAGPGGGSEAKPVGTVCYAVALGARCEVRREVFGGDRESVRERSAQAALMLLLRMLEERAVIS